MLWARNFAEVPSENWQLPDPSGLHYLYIGGLQAGKETAPLAYEPEYYESGRLVLFTDGHIERLQNGDLDHALRAEKR